MQDINCEAKHDPGAADVGRYSLRIVMGSSSGMGDFIRDDTSRCGDPAAVSFLLTERSPTEETERAPTKMFWLTI
jgi:hypothetical protein